MFTFSPMATQRREQAGKPPEEEVRRGIPSFLFLLGLYKLLNYLCKLGADGHAVVEYYEQRELYFLVLSVACLLIPFLVYTVFLVGGAYTDRGNPPRPADVGTKLIHGLLLIPWQVKVRADVLHYTSQRVCHKRRLEPTETKEVEDIQRQGDVLEFFEDFYAGFLQLVLQTYLFVLSLKEAVSAKILIFEVVTSSLALLSLLAAVRRKDDGILTGFLSFVGWLTIFAARVVAFALAAGVLHGWILIPTVLHVLAVTYWVFLIARDSYADTVAIAPSRKTLLSLSLTLFGIPSLIYWPIMFHLKAHYRPIKYLLLIICENAACLIGWYFVTRPGTDDAGAVALIAVVLVGSLVGPLFILLYTFLKPKYTDQVVLHHMHVQNAENFGSYFDFCNTLFNLPRTQWVEENIEKVTRMEQQQLTS